MKIQLTYDELVHRAHEIARHIKDTIESPKLYAVARGGFSLAHLVGYKLALPVGVFYPKHQRLVRPDIGEGTHVFLEDVIATGRTVKAIDLAMREESSHYVIFPVVVDSNCPKFDRVEYSTALVTTDWIVFPYEDFDAVSEGDRGLFREGTSNNAKARI